MTRGWHGFAAPLCFVLPHSGAGVNKTAPQTIFYIRNSPVKGIEYG